MSEKGKILLISFCSVLVALVLAEFYIRGNNPYLITDETKRPSGIIDESREKYGSLVKYTLQGKRLIPDTRVTYHNSKGEYPVVEVNINSHGFRGREIPGLKGPGETRVLVLGDSISMALDYPLEKTYVGRMETGLREILPDRQINVINAGLDGIGLRDEIGILVDKGLELEPDVVMVQAYLNDSRPADEFGALIARPNWLRRHSVAAEVIYRNYRKRQWLDENFDRYRQYVWTEYPLTPALLNDRRAFLDFAAIARLDWGAAWEEDSWDTIETQFERLAKLSRQEGFKVVIAAFPVTFQVYAAFLEDTPQRRWAELSGAYGFYFHDLLPDLRRLANDNKRLFIDQCHLHGYGHEVVGGILAEFMAEQVLDPGDGQSTGGQDNAADS